MGRSTGIFQDAKTGKWRVDKVYRGERLQGRFDSYQDAEQSIVTRCAQIEAHGPVSKKTLTLGEAAARYLFEQKRLGKASLVTEGYLLSPVIDLLGELSLDQIHDGTLRRFIDKRLGEGKSHKTINLSLGVVRHILNLAARRWRTEVGGGRTAPLLHQVPLITMLPLVGHQREPRPISWEEQRRLLPLLPTHLARMALFVLNTGVRDNVVISLRWAWEREVTLDKGVKASVFEVPREYVKGRKAVRYVMCNSVAQSVINSVRGQHQEFVFVWRRERVKNLDREPAMAYRPVTSMNNTAWVNGCAKAGLDGLHVHDLRHTVGMRLREAGVPEDTRADILWHSRQSMTAHYSMAQAREIHSALEQIKDESGRANAMLFAMSAPSKSLQKDQGPKRCSA